MPVILMPACWIWMIACSRPAPGPRTRTSHSSTPCLRAAWAAFSAARPAAKGVLLRAPLKPTVPADAHDSVSPFMSVMVTMVLLKVALMWATPLETPLRTFFLAAALAPAAGLPAPSDIASASFADHPDYAVPAVDYGPHGGPYKELLTKFLNALLTGDGLAGTFA